MHFLTYQIAWHILFIGIGVATVFITIHHDAVVEVSLHVGQLSGDEADEQLRNYVLSLKRFATCQQAGSSLLLSFSFYLFLPFLDTKSSLSYVVLYMVYGLDSQS